MTKKVGCVLTLAMLAVVVNVGVASAAPITMKQAASQYVRDVGPVNNAVNEFVARITAWTNAPNRTLAQTTPYVHDVVAQLVKFDRTMLSQRWPVRSIRDVRALAQDVATFTGDVELLPTLGLFSVSQWSSSYARDENRMVIQADFVRRDLGLGMARG